MEIPCRSTHEVGQYYATSFAELLDMGGLLPFAYAATSFAEPHDV